MREQPPKNEQFEMDLMSVDEAKITEHVEAAGGKVLYDSEKNQYTVTFVDKGVVSVFSLDLPNAQVTLRIDECSDSFSDEPTHQAEPAQRPLKDAQDFHDERKLLLEQAIQDVLHSETAGD